MDAKELPKEWQVELILRSTRHKLLESQYRILYELYLEQLQHNKRLEANLKQLLKETSEGNKR